MKKCVLLLLMTLTFASCKKHKLKKEIERVAGTYTGWIEVSGGRTHFDSTTSVTDTAYSLGYDFTVKIEPFGFSDNEIVARGGNLIDFKVIYLGHNIKTEYTYQTHYSGDKATLVYYPSTDSLFIITDGNSNTGFSPYYNTSRHCYFRGRRISN